MPRRGTYESARLRAARERIRPLALRPAGSYRFALGSTDRTPHAASELTGTRYYIPRLPRTAYPRWFVVCGSYVTLSAG